MKHFFFFLLSTALFSVFAAAQPPVVTISVPLTHANDGKQMYASYCASCHGVSGHGNGAMAATFHTHPTDLTVLSRNNHGAYPTRHVEAVLHFGVETSGLGSKAMPVWGPVLASIGNINSPNDTVGMLRIRNITRYVETLQAK